MGLLFRLRRIFFLFIKKIVWHSEWILFTLMKINIKTKLKQKANWLFSTFSFLKLYRTVPVSQLYVQSKHTPSGVNSEINAQNKQFR